jgi:hypothetical protein
MAIDEQTIIEERTLLKKDYDMLSEKIKQYETDLGTMRSNLNAVYGALQLCDKFLKLGKENEKV